MALPSSHTSGRQLFAKARLLLAGLAVLTIVPAVLLPVDCLLRARCQAQPVVRWMRALDLSSPAFLPAGTALRHPETTVPGVDLRHAPFLPLRRPLFQNDGRQGAGEP